MKNQSFSEEISAETVLFRADFWLQKFSLSVLLRDFQVMNSIESELKQPRSLLIISELELISAGCL